MHSCDMLTQYALHKYALESFQLWYSLSALKSRIPRRQSESCLRGTFYFDCLPPNNESEQLRHTNRDHVISGLLLNWYLYLRSRQLIKGLLVLHKKGILCHGLQSNQCFNGRNLNIYDVVVQQLVKNAPICCRWSQTQEQIQKSRGAMQTCQPSWLQL